MSSIYLDTAAVTVIIPESTTAAPTTTTDRHMTFWMDPRNIAWVTVAAILFTGLLLFCAYLIVRYGNFSFFHNVFKPRYNLVHFQFVIDFGS